MKKPSYQVATKKKPACHVRALKESESGSQLIKGKVVDLLTAINKNVCCTTMAIARAKNAPAAHNKGSFPLPEYTHRPAGFIRITCLIIEQSH